jgi:magnesium-transporting ATPase (P-type)
MHEVDQVVIHIHFTVLHLCFNYDRWTFFRDRGHHMESGSSPSETYRHSICQLRKQRFCFLNQCWRVVQLAKIVWNFVTNFKYIVLTINFLVAYWCTKVVILVCWKVNETIFKLLLLYEKALFYLCLAVGIWIIFLLVHFTPASPAMLAFTHLQRVKMN